MVCDSAVRVSLTARRPGQEICLCYSVLQCSQRASLKLPPSRGPPGGVSLKLSNSQTPTFPRTAGGGVSQTLKLPNSHLPADRRVALHLEEHPREKAGGGVAPGDHEVEDDVLQLGVVELVAAAGVWAAAVEVEGRVLEESRWRAVGEPLESRQRAVRGRERER